MTIKLTALDKHEHIVTALEAYLKHKDGDRYTDIESGKPLRLHTSPRGFHQLHFEFEPRWDEMS